MSAGLAPAEAVADASSGAAVGSGVAASGVGRLDAATANAGAPVGDELGSGSAPAAAGVDCGATWPRIAIRAASACVKPSTLPGASDALEASPPGVGAALAAVA